MKLFLLGIFFTISVCIEGLNAQENSYKTIINQRLETIRQGLDTMLFVKRFESIETPCVCIESNDKEASKKHLNNSNYRIGFFKNDTIYRDGVACLSNYCSRYASFRVKCINVEDQTISGEASFTYGYPASSIIQYLGFAHEAEQKDKAFCDKLLKSTGNFVLYPENDRYRLKVSLNTGPYDEKDTFYAYLEIVNGAFNKKPSYEFYFDQMSLNKGDKNNQIALKFSTTNFDEEAKWHSVLLYNTIKYLKTDKKDRNKAEAIWVNNFYSNPDCKQCQFVFEMAQNILRMNAFKLPDTDPVPAH